MTRRVTRTVVVMARMEEPKMAAPIGSHSLSSRSLYSMMPTPAGTKSKAKWARSTLTTGRVFCRRPWTVISANRKRSMPMTEPGTGAPVRAEITTPASWNSSNKAIVRIMTWYEIKKNKNRPQKRALRIAKPHILPLFMQSA